MKGVVYGLAGLLGLLGLVFIAGAQGLVARYVLGAVLLVAGLTLVAVMRLRPSQTTITQKIDLSGDVAVERLVCQQCAGMLDASSVRVEAGAIFVACPYCKAAYQIEEAPKW
ncbi:MAG: hypothetical protein P1V51_04055 [Deltaproteobacteria bacterium]|nr:hypothetical protein [Deltaproteobacteria bacterium]